MYSIKKAFDTVRADDILKESTISFLEKERKKQSRKYRFPLHQKGLIAACIAMIMLLGGGSWYNLSITPLSYISIDINPSIELTLNRWDRVITASAYNDEGSKILSGVSVKGMKYTDAVDKIIESDELTSYMSDGSALTFTMASKETDKEEELQLGIESTDGCKNHGGYSYCVNPEMAEEARNKGISLGKYNAYLELSKYDSSVTIEECRDMTMSQIRDKIDECSGGTVEVHGAHNGKQSGEGNGNGNHGGNHKGNGNCKD